MVTRVQSPSSINTFKQCKRKYYYQYIEELPTSGSIHTVRGNIAHTALEHFYDIDVSGFTLDTYRQQFRIALQGLFIKAWGAERDRLLGLDMPTEEISEYFRETLMMLFNWCDHFLSDFSTELGKGKTLPEAFLAITPETELEFLSEEYKVRGFVDAIHTYGDEIHIVDYKTNKWPGLKDSIRLQLAIYCLMYEEKYGKRPTKVGAFFLRDRLHMMDVDEALLQRAKHEIRMIHQHTERTSDEIDYPQTVTGLCKWRTGKCDFYDTCQPHS